MSLDKLEGFLFNIKMKHTSYIYKNFQDFSVGFQYFGFHNS